MSEPAEKTAEKPVDQHLEKRAASLSADRIEKAVNAVLNGETGARLKVYVDTCVHCGLCSEACHYYLSHDKDPAYSRPER